MKGPKIKMAILTAVILSYMAMVTNAEGITSVIGKGIQKEISAAKQPVEEGLTYIGSSQCSKVKKLVGVAYEQLDGDSEKEPDLNKLALEFWSREARIILNISTAAHTITESRSFNSGNKIIIFCHGYTDDPSKNSFQNISKAFRDRGEYHVLALDGSSLIKWLYLRSSTYVRFMGEKLGEVLAAMVKKGIDPKSIHIIGHSLGAHISGFTGKTFYKMTGTRVGRISGLDPAGPCFSHVDPELRLHPDDADFVDVMHTDGGVYGLKDPIGQVDYYPNSGSEQPNCLFQTCSHSRTWLYYAESVVNPTAFPSIRCANWEEFKKGKCTGDVSYMGYPSKPGTKGLYFLQTNDDKPYGRGEKGLKYKDNEAYVKKITNLFL